MTSVPAPAPSRLDLYLQLIRWDRPPGWLQLLSPTLSAQWIARGYDWSLSERSFFGVMRVANSPDPRLGGDVHVLMHGTTLHGAQARDGRFDCVPTLYYAASTMICVPTSLDQPVGAALGAQAGLAKLAATISDGGFSRVRKAADAPFNMIREARP